MALVTLNEVGLQTTPFIFNFARQVTLQPKKFEKYWHMVEAVESAAFPLLFLLVHQHVDALMLAIRLNALAFLKLMHTH